MSILLADQTSSEENDILYMVEPDNSLAIHKIATIHCKIPEVTFIYQTAHWAWIRLDMLMKGTDPNKIRDEITELTNKLGFNLGSLGLEKTSN